MSAAAGTRRGSRRPVIHLQALSLNRIVIEVSTSGSERLVAVGVGNPPPVDNGAVTIDTLAAEIEVMEIGPDQALTVLPIRIVTAVPGSAVERTAYSWRDLDDALRYDADLRQINRVPTAV